MSFRIMGSLILFLFILTNLFEKGVVAQPVSEIRCGEIPFLKDNKLNWSEIPFLKGKFFKAGKVKGPLASQQTKVKIVYDRENLYLLVRCSEKNMDKVVALFNGPDVWKDDCIEIFIDTNLDRTTYFQFVVSVSGEKYGWGLDRRKGITEDWDAKVNKGPDYWQVEITLPFHLLKMEPHSGNIIGVSFCRERRAGTTEYSTWTPPRGFHKPDEFGRLIFGSYYDFLRITAKSIKKSLQEINPYLKEIPDESKIISKVQKWQALLQEAETYIKNHNLNDTKFSLWIKRWEELKETTKLKGVEYEIKLERLLNQ